MLNWNDLVSVEYLKHLIKIDSRNYVICNDRV